MAVSSKAPALIDEHVSVEQCEKAVTSLMKHAKSKQEKEDENELLPGKEQHVWLVIAVKKMDPKKNLKPQRVPLAHPLVDPRTTAVCLITKDPQREYKDLLENKNIKFISRVVGLEKLKGKFKGFDARRLLLRENGLFLADDRVLPLLPKLLGKEWFKAKKQPIPVSLTKKDLKAELEKAISSTYFHQNQGTCTSVKIANVSHKESQVLANLKAAIPAVVSKIPGGWENIQSLNIKTSSSTSLPIWTCPLGSEDPESRWVGMDIDEEELGGISDDSVEEDSEEKEEDKKDKKTETKLKASREEGKKSKASKDDIEKSTPSAATKPASNLEPTTGKKRTADMVADEDADTIDAGKKKKKKKAKNDKPVEQVSQSSAPAKLVPAANGESKTVEKTTEPEIPSTSTPSAAAKPLTKKEKKKLKQQATNAPVATASESAQPATSEPPKPAKETTSVPVAQSETPSKKEKKKKKKHQQPGSSNGSVTEPAPATPVAAAPAPAAESQAASAPLTDNEKPKQKKRKAAKVAGEAKVADEAKAVSADASAATPTPTAAPAVAAPANGEKSGKKKKKTKQQAAETITKEELKEKKAVLGDAKLEKKKAKLKEGEKGSRKTDAKTQLVGRGLM